MSKSLKNLKLYEPHFGSEELLEIEKVLKGGILTSGVWVEKLEKKFAEYIGSKYTVAVNSCSSAIFLCLQFYKDKIKTIEIPSVTFVSVANAIKNSGFKIKFEDKSYVGTYYYLKPTNIIDSAHYLKKGCYKKNSLMCFSFYPTKILGGAEGGIIALNDKKAYQWLIMARNHGMCRRSQFDWNYEVKFAGWKMNMTNIQAAIILTRLDNLECYNLKRANIRYFYNKKLKINNSSLHIYYLFVKDRNKFIKKMKKFGIATTVNFKPIHLQPAYFDKKIKLPFSEWWGKHCVSVPLHENLTLNDIEYIIDKIKKYGTLLKITL